MLHPYWFPHDQLHVILNPWRHGTVLWCQQPMNLYMIIVYHFTPRKQQLNIRQQSLLNCVISLLSFLVTIPSLLYGKWWTEFVVTHFYHMAANMHCWNISELPTSPHQLKLLGWTGRCMQLNTIQAHQPAFSQQFTLPSHEIGPTQAPPKHKWNKIWIASIVWLILEYAAYHCISIGTTI